MNTRANGSGTPRQGRLLHCDTPAVEQITWSQAVLLAQRVQLQLKSAEQTSKDDASPVTIADYGASITGLISDLAHVGHGISYGTAFGPLHACSHRGREAHALQRADAGAQAVVAWSLSKAFPNGRLQMVAEEDSSDLRCACRSLREGGRRARGRRDGKRITIRKRSNREWPAGVDPVGTASSTRVPQLCRTGGCTKAALDAVMCCDPEGTPLRCAERRAAERCGLASRSW